MRLLNRQDWTVITLLVPIMVGIYTGSYCDGRFCLVLWPFAGLGLLMLGVVLTLLFVVMGLSSQLKGGGVKQFLGRLLVVFAPLSLGLPNPWSRDLYRRGCTDHVKSTVTTLFLVDEVRRIAVEKLGNKESTGPEYFYKASAFGLPAVFKNSGWGYPHVTVEKGKDPARPHVHLEWGGALIGHHGLVITDEVLPPDGFPMHGGDHPDVPFSTTTYTPWLAGTYIMLDSE